MTNTSNQYEGKSSPMDREFFARVMGVGAIASISICIVLGNMSFWAAAWLLLLAMGLIVTRSFSCVVLILVFCFGHPLAMAWRSGAWHITLTPNDLLLTIGVLGFSASSLSYIGLDPRRFRWQGATFGDARHEAERRRDGSHAVMLRPLSLSLLRLPAAVALAWVTLAICSQDAFWPNLFRFDPAVLRMIVVAWTLAILVGIPASLLSLVRWRNLQPAQAEVYLRSELAKEIGREQKYVERALACTKAKAKRTRSMEDVADHS